MATYAAIQQWVKKKSGFVPKTCWIAHVKELNGLDPKVAPNRAKSGKRLVQCPPEKVAPIRAAMVHFGMLR